MTRKFWLAVLAYIVPTFPIGYFWHLVVFKTTYDALQVYRQDIMCLAAPLAWSFMVIAVSAKHQMSLASGFVLIETGFILLHFLVVSPLIALAYAAHPALAHKTASQA